MNFLGKFDLNFNENKQLIKQYSSEEQFIFESKSDAEIQTIKTAAAIVSKIIQKAKKSIKIGMSTKELDEIMFAEMEKYNCKPAFYGYRGYPANSCISINHELVHGIPKENKKIFYDQIVSIDVGIVFEGFYADAATTFLISNKNQTNTNAKTKEILRLLDVTYNSMINALSTIKAGNRVGDISYAIQQYVEKNGYNVIREYVGHAIGRCLHEKPDIPNFGKKAEGMQLYPGMVLCIEPMVSMGNYETKVLDDGWTVVMKDNSLCAHFEHMVLVNHSGIEIITDEEVIKPQQMLL